MEEDAFDVVIFNLILSVIPDGAACLRENLRALKPGGRAVVFDKFLPDNGRLTLGRRLLNMGSNDGADDEKPVHEVYLDAYWMDQTEVTNGQYAQCVAAGECNAAGRTDSYSRDSYYGYTSFDDSPVITVDWNQAAVYCAWAGRGLPTEAQWEKAARGTDGRQYPRGDAFDCHFGNFDDETKAGSDVVAGGPNCDGYADTAPMGSYPAGASPYGALDLAGNVWEWTADWYGPYPSGEQTNLAGPASGEYRVLRGGSWYVIEYFLRSSIRNWLSPDYRYNYFGFRCSRSLP